MHPKLGTSWEGFALEEIIRKLRIDNNDCYFWATQGGAELDLLALKASKKLGFEIKYTDSPKITKSIYSAIEDLKLDTMSIIIPGRDKFKLSEEVTVCGLEVFANESS